VAFEILYVLLLISHPEYGHSKFIRNQNILLWRERERKDAVFSETLVDYHLGLKIAKSPTGNTFKIERNLISWQGNPYWTL
jgi:hypothetical protein